MIETRQLTVHAGPFRLHDVSIDIPHGEWGVVIGSAGAGKTTLLESIAGVRRVAAGAVRLRGVDVTRDSPESRGIGLVYQHGYLFPHLSVEQNTAYGADSVDAVGALRDRFGIGALATRRVDSLSGGERQVVALVRALATAPDILLLDEPFAALDPRRRTHVRSELRALQRAQGFTVLQVTHDLDEAGLLGNVLMVLEEGTLLQSGTPADVFRAPASASVAAFIGAENLLAGQISADMPGDPEAERTFLFTNGDIQLSVAGVHPGGPGHAVIRADDIIISTSEHESSARNTIHGTIRELLRSGVLTRVTVTVGATPLVATITTAAAEQLRLQVGASVVASIKATAVHLC